jgi:hypothetical protein
MRADDHKARSLNSSPLFSESSAGLQTGCTEGLQTLRAIPPSHDSRILHLPREMWESSVA